MAEEKDAAQVEQELAELDAGRRTGPQGGKGASEAGVTPRLLPSPGIVRSPRWEAIADREAVAAMKARVADRAAGAVGRAAVGRDAAGTPGDADR
jgi:phospholipid/cholesterol/gamma-HCH transport system ATP-binding protein